MYSPNKRCKVQICRSHLLQWCQLTDLFVSDTLGTFPWTANWWQRIKWTARISLWSPTTLPRTPIQHLQKFYSRNSSKLERIWICTKKKKWNLKNKSRMFSDCLKCPITIHWLGTTNLWLCSEGNLTIFVRNQFGLLLVFILVVSCKWRSFHLGKLKTTKTLQNFFACHKTYN